MKDEERDLVSGLEGYEAFAGCDRDDVAALVEAGGPFSLPADWPLVQEGVPADACYVLSEGEANVFRDGEHVAALGVGDLVGELTLLGGGQRRATVTSSTHVAGLRIDNEALVTVMKAHPAIASAFRNVYRQRDETGR